ncbi:MAG: phosphatidyl-myo-inositol alpha-mannosyltransferase [Chloroflexota bacterium]|nr:phosphatidyl-myo-inositol alpha-mannosyltransferase [Chloroflexota bacterium]
MSVHPSGGLRIALVSPYDFSHPGGVTEHISHLARELRRRGATVKLMAPASGDLPEQMDDFAEEDFYRIGRPIPIPVNGSIARITMSFHLSRSISRILERERFDVIHCHEPLLPLPVTTLRSSKVCNVGTFHAYAESSSAYYYGKPFVRRYFRKLHGRIAVSTPARDFVSQYFPATYSVVPNGVDVPYFASGATPLPEFQDGKLNLLFVGRLEKRKGLGTLLRAYLTLKETLPALRLVVVGDGRMREGYERYIEAHRIPDIVMAGYVSREDLPRYHASADIFVAPNTGKESFGIVLLEAMAAGLPVVATDIPGFAHVVSPGREGILVRQSDPVNMSSAIHLLASDPSLRARLGAAGRRTAAGYSWDRVVDQVVDVYDNALRRWHRTPFNSGTPAQLARVADLRRDGAPTYIEELEIVHDAIPGLG